MIAHNVYFSLTDASDDAVESLLADCRQYLTGHDGLSFFACGRLAEGYDRPVNDQDFQVALHTVFETRAAHDTYQTAERHLTFIDRQKSNWSNVRVFDSEVSS